MKTLLFKFLFVFTVFQSVGQEKLILYSGVHSNDYFQYPFYAFEGLKLKDTVFHAPGDTAIFAWDTTSNFYVGGFGNQNYGPGEAGRIASAYNGRFAATFFSFEASANLRNTKIRVDLNETASSWPPVNSWGYEFSICQDLSCFSKVSALLSSFKKNTDLFDPVGRNMTAEDFSRVNSIHFNIVSENRGQILTSVLVDNIMLEEGEITGIGMDAPVSGNNKLKIYDSSGLFIYEGTFKDFTPAAGKLYFISDNNEVKKVIFQ